MTNVIEPVLSSYSNRMVKASDTGGAMPVDLVGRLARDRERLIGMTDAERAFRKQWLKAQELSPNEPKFVPELYMELNNPIKRAYRFPLNALRTAIAPVVGQEAANKIRYFSGKFLMLTAFAFACTYYFKYNENDWTRKGGWRRIQSRVAILEGDPEYPKQSERTQGSDYASRGFKDMNLNL